MTNWSTNNTLIITHCPACGQVLILEPIFGGTKNFTCPIHRTFNLSNTVIQIVNNDQNLMRNLGNLIEQGRHNDLNPILIEHVH